MQTVSAKKKDADSHRRWFVVDAKGQVLGRLASQVASILRGKNNVGFSTHIDTGDFVVVINAAEVAVTGNKEEGKVYHRHTGWVGGIVTKTVAELREENPEEIITLAVKGMLPKGNLGRHMLSKLKVYGGGEHPHAAQKPEPLALN